MFRKSSSIIFRPGFVGHGGSCPAFRSQLLLKSDERVATVVLPNAQGVDTGRYAQVTYDLVAPAIKEAAKPDAPAPKPVGASLSAYLGNYTIGFAGEVAFVRWEDGPASLSLPTANPVDALTKWKNTGAHTFRRFRKDEALGEEIVFTVRPDGKATQLTWHSNVYRRLR